MSFECNRCGRLRGNGEVGLFIRDPDGERTYCKDCEAEKIKKLSSMGEVDNHPPSTLQSYESATYTHAPRSCTLAGCRGNCGICTPPNKPKSELPDRIWAFGDKLAGFHSGMWRDENILDGIHNVEYLRSEKVRKLVELLEEYADSYSECPEPKDYNAMYDEIWQLKQDLFSDGLK